MYRTVVQHAVFAVILGSSAFLRTDRADAGCGWRHGLAHHGYVGANYGSWGSSYDYYGYSSIGYGVGYAGNQLGSYGYRYGSGYGLGYDRPRYYTRWDYPYNWGWSHGLSGHHIWGHWYSDGGIWGVTPVGAAIRAYGPSRYYPTYDWTPRPFLGAPAHGMPYSTPIYHGAQTGQPERATDRLSQPQPSAVAQETQIATLTVTVPEDARVYINGRKTTTKGTFRRYESAGLQASVGYTFEVRSEVERNGQIVTDTQKVALRSGETRNLVFDLEPVQSALTSLTLHVPEDAKVELAGSRTTATGPVRTYTTGGLAAGQSVSDYTVRVSVERNGRVQTKEQAIHLVGGRNVELSFQFDGTQLASVR